MFGGMDDPPVNNGYCGNDVVAAFAGNPARVTSATPAMTRARSIKVDFCMVFMMRSVSAGTAIAE